MLDANATPPPPVNEPVLSYAPGTPERRDLQAKLNELAATPLEMPMWINGEPVETGDREPVRSPHDHGLLLGHLHNGTAEHALAAIRAAQGAHAAWSAMPFEARAAIFLRAAELAAGAWRPVLNGATMLNQSKTAHQAEIDAACELVDFLRFNVCFADRLRREQPISGPGMWNRVDLRPLEGFVLAATPFNFTAIAANLPAAPALMGNTVVWKPSALAPFSGHHVMELFRKAGLPDGVVNLVNGPPAAIVNACLDHPDLAGVHFTGSTEVFQKIWARVGQQIGRYRTYPRLVGETGGKDFVFAHESADLDALAVALVRGAFEFQGQKCSAASRAYVPRSSWPKLKERLQALVAEIRIGDVRDFSNFMGAVISEGAFNRLEDHIALARSDGACSIVAGGQTNRENGWFVHPTIVETSDPKHVLMERELFGPLLTIWVYPENDVEAALDVCNATSPYALTGAVIANDRAFVERALAKLRFAAGNFYINDKPTGAVVGQQPFGGARASGTNDKAGSAWNLMRWVSPRTVKETFVPPTSVPYPFMAK